MTVGAVQSSALAATSGKDNPAKVVKAAQQFEAILLNDLLGHLQKTFMTLPGENSELKSDNYEYLGTQALASGLASRGGLGIANLIAHKLLQAK